MDEYSREPCPMRIFDDMGGAFSMGAIGGAIFHSISGYRNAAAGQRMRGVMQNVRLRAPITGGQFAAWGGMFSAIDCSLVWARQKEDHWNAIMAGGMTGALLTVRSGPTTMLVSGCVGAVLLGLIEGVGVLMTRVTASQFDPTAVQGLEDPSALPAKQPSTSSGGSGAFGATESTPFGLGGTPNVNLH